MYLCLEQYSAWSTGSREILFSFTAYYWDQILVNIFFHYMSHLLCWEVHLAVFSPNAQVVISYRLCFPLTFWYLTSVDGWNIDWRRVPAVHTSTWCTFCWYGDFKNSLKLLPAKGGHHCISPSTLDTVPVGIVPVVSCQSYCTSGMENIVIFSKMSDNFDIYCIYIKSLIYIEYLSNACIMQWYIQ